MTEGLRFNKGKAHLEMVPIHLLEETAQVFYNVTTREVNPYPRWNWTLEQDWSVPYACALRHLSKWYSGEDNDTETGLSHLAHVMCNLLMLEHYRKAFPDRDDRPSNYFNNKENTIEESGSHSDGDVRQCCSRHPQVINEGGVCCSSVRLRD